MTVPLGEWVTIAVTGGRPQQGVYGTDTEDEVRRLLQLRVQAHDQVSCLGLREGLEVQHLESGSGEPLEVR